VRRYTVAFLNALTGTFVCDNCVGCDALLKLKGRIELGCIVHARRKFCELAKIGQNQVATQAMQRCTESSTRSCCHVASID